MNPQILKLWIESRRSHVQYCQAIGIKFTEPEANAILSILDELEEDFNLELYAKEEYQFQNNF
jgi:hypothetical protein